MVFTGLEVLLRDHIDELRGKAVGIVGNHAAVTRDLIHASDALKEAGVRIAALYGPEHGARGDIADGELIGDSVDERLGVPVYSLYGKTRKPTPESLRGIDVMLVDIQDVGARFYTFIYTTAKLACPYGCLIGRTRSPGPTPRGRSSNLSSLRSLECTRSRRGTRSLWASWLACSGPAAASSAT